jgi:tRNA A-37 threonylcarbamoyl transferase component Bud32
MACIHIVATREADSSVQGPFIPRVIGDDRGAAATTDRRAGAPGRLAALAEHDLLETPAPAADRMLETIVRESQPAATDESPLVGSRFGRYTVLEEIGRGAMANVYTAYDEQLDRKIAIKLIRDPAVRVRGEARAIARVAHPNVVQVYEIGTFQGHDFIAMELIDGINLAAWQRLRSRDVYDIIAKYAEAGRGLAAAHRAGLVHRDFKPDNVLIDNTGRPRVGDFGLASTRVAADPIQRAVTLVSSDDLDTRDDAIVGTPAYMAPEQFRSPDVDERADQFSLCAALYEAVYGVRPFRGASVEELRASASSGVLQTAAPGTSAPPGLRALLLRGLSVDPAARWPSLADLLDRLDELDAQRDPAAAGRERRRLVLAVVGVSIITTVVPFIRDDHTVEDLIYMPMVVLAVAAVGVYLGRHALLRSNYHRRMITLMFSTIVGYIIIPLLTAQAGCTIAQIFLVELLAQGLVYLLAAPLIEPLLILNCLGPWVGASAIAFGAPAFQTSTMFGMLSVLVFAMSWSRMPRARQIFSIIGNHETIRRSN